MLLVFKCFFFFALIELSVKFQIFPLLNCMFILLLQYYLQTRLYYLLQKYSIISNCIEILKQSNT